VCQTNSINFALSLEHYSAVCSVNSKISSINLEAWALTQLRWRWRKSIIEFLNNHEKCLFRWQSVLIAICIHFIRIQKKQKGFSLSHFEFVIQLNVKIYNLGKSVLHEFTIKGKPLDAAHSKIRVCGCECVRGNNFPIENSFKHKFNLIQINYLLVLSNAQTLDRCCFKRHTTFIWKFHFEHEIYLCINVMLHDI
jgi:hypothetical protein